MPLNETQILQSAMAFLDCVDSFQPELGLFEFVRQPKWPLTIIDFKLAVLVSRESEQMPCCER
jgi:hypothetical protein